VFDTENLFFLETMEIEIAGTKESRNDMMPLLYIDTEREKAELNS